jgi:NAD(P)-dependent dehydrogenase (short-subunit alcohol dehydrogenase family)
MMNILVTGANRGIGLELVQQLTARGENVIAVCRESNPELQQTGARIIDGIDVTSDDSVAGLAGAIEGTALDWLINNAGVFSSESLSSLDFTAMEHQFRVNSLGPLRVSAALQSFLGRGSKVFVISSRMGSIADNTSGSSYGYRMSKAAVNCAAKSLSIDWHDAGIGVFVLHPGYVATDMTNHRGPTSTGDSVNSMLERMDTLDMSSSGTFWHAKGEELPW